MGTQQARDLYESATLLVERGQYQEAVSYYQRAIELEPSAFVWTDLGTALAHVGELEAAIKAHQTALEYDPKSALVWLNLSVVYGYNLDWAERDRCLDQALLLDPQHLQARFNKSFSFLGRGELKRGWEAYEAGLGLQSGRFAPNYGYIKNVLIWNGEPLSEKSLLIVLEQGVGDQILLSTLLTTVLQQTTRIILVCHPKLALLLQRTYPEIVVHGLDYHDRQRFQQLPPCDYQIVSGSLLRWLRCEFADFPEYPRYFVTSPKATLAIAEKFSLLPSKPKIGITWRSGFSDPERNNDHASLEVCVPLLKDTRVIWVSVQYGLTETEKKRLQELGVEIFSEIDLFNDLDNSAALLSQLEGVVGTATATTHLAAAVGTPTALVLRCGGNWWMLGTDHYPWFPNVRVFRHPHPQDWLGAFQQVTQKFIDGLIDDWKSSLS